MVAPDEMRREIVFCRVAARRAIRFHAVDGHVVGAQGLLECEEEDERGLDMLPKR